MESADLRPQVRNVVLIDDRRIEVRWDRQVFHADTEDNFEVCLDGKPQSLVHWTEDMPWTYGTVYQKETGVTTLALVEPADVNLADHLTLRVTKEVRSLRDVPADYDQVYTLRYSPHYTCFKKTRDGLLIKGSKVIQPYSLDVAASIVDLMLEKRPEIAAELVRRHADVSVYGLMYDAYDVPEHRLGYWLATRHVEGYGGEMESPWASISESNLIRLRSGRYATMYPHEMILVHEFGHSIHLVGINGLADQTLAQLVRDTYQHAKDNGLWPNSYAISNYEEYFATLSTVWFNVMQEGIDGKWDGIRGPVNTRDELQEYDPDGYRLMAEIYPDKQLPRPWRFNKDNYDIHGRPRTYDLDVKFDWEFIK